MARDNQWSCGKSLMEYQRLRIIEHTDYRFQPASQLYLYI